MVNGENNNIVIHSKKNLVELLVNYNVNNLHQITLVSILIMIRQMIISQIN